VDATGKKVFHGAIDSHVHVGIYRPLSEDAASESASAASGGVTTICSYFRTGSNYLDKTGAFKEIFAELPDKSAGSYRIDYAYHVACMSSAQLGEIEWLVKEEVARVNQDFDGDPIKLSIHCEQPEIITTTAAWARAHPPPGEDRRRGGGELRAGNHGAPGRRSTGCLRPKTESRSSSA